MALPVVDTFHVELLPTISFKFEPDALESANERPVWLKTPLPLRAIERPVISLVIPVVSEIASSVPDVWVGVIVCAVVPGKLVSSVPLAGNVTFVDAVVVRVNGNEPTVVNASAKFTFFPPASVKVSPAPPVLNAILFVLRVVESLIASVLLSVPFSVKVLLTVKVFPAAILNVLVPLFVIANPLNVVALTSPLTVSFDVGLDVPMPTLPVPFGLRRIFPDVL